MRRSAFSDSPGHRRRGHKHDFSDAHVIETHIAAANTLGRKRQTALGSRKAGMRRSAFSDSLLPGSSVLPPAH